MDNVSNIREDGLKFFLYECVIHLEDSKEFYDVFRRIDVNGNKTVYSNLYTFNTWKMHIILSEEELVFLKLSLSKVQLKKISERNEDYH